MSATDTSTIAHVDATKTRVTYRLLKGWEPQQQYNMGMKLGLRWYPLNEQGYWLEPDAYNYGVITKHNYFTLGEAKRICLRAQAINQHHIEAA